MNKDSITQRLRNRAKELNVSYNTLLNQFFYDEFLKLLSQSSYRDLFILKGGILLIHNLGIQQRSTIDIDFLIKELTLDEKELREALEDFLQSRKGDLYFELEGDAQEIRNEDKYGGLRFRILGRLSNIRVPFSIDFATGDPVYPSAKLLTYTTALGDIFGLRMYPLETVLAEKLQTILYRAEANGRSKDLYDIHAILKANEGNLDFGTIRQAMNLTFTYRKTNFDKKQAEDILSKINRNTGMKERWKRYREKNPYVGKLEFETVINSIRELIDNCFG